MGVAVLAPNKNLFWGGGSGLQRTDGVAHAAAVNSLIQNQLPKDMAFDPGNVFFTGVSGGALLLSGFFVPAFGAQYKTGVVLNCGALAPQVNVADAATLATSMKIHFQSTQDELALLQPAIPKAITAYEKLATTAGMSAAQIGAMQTVDNTPNGGGHCGFDGKGFVTGVQLMSTNYANIMGADATGQVTGIGNVKKVSNFPVAIISNADMITYLDCCRERGIEVHQRHVTLASPNVQLLFQFLPGMPHGSSE
jgi:poly(3-hydroxybutyrate) depolymerase